MNSYVDNNIITLHIMAEGEGQGKPVSKQMQPVILYPWVFTNHGLILHG